MSYSLEVLKYNLASACALKTAQQSLSFSELVNLAENLSVTPQKFPNRLVEVDQAAGLHRV